MNRKHSQDWMTMLSDWLELFYLQAVLPEQNDIIPIPTTKNSTTLCYTALCFTFHYEQQNPATYGSTAYKLPLAVCAKQFGMRWCCKRALGMFL
jgi:hypothetical protein